jgi:DNA-binding transcriptional MocR family regulator
MTAAVPHQCEQELRDPAGLPGRPDLGERVHARQQARAVAKSGRGRCRGSGRSHAASLRVAAAALLNEHQTRRPEALRQLRAQRDALLHALGEHLPEVDALQPVGGMTLWATFPAPISSRLAAAAPDHGVTIAAGPRFGIGGAFERNIRLPYTLPASRLRQAVRRLARARQVAQGTGGTHTPAPLA